METRKLYYENCRLAEFEAAVLSCTETKDGYDVVLNATAFYPEGGGQAADVGTLGGVHVRHTREQGETVVHECDSPLAVGQTVVGRIDYARRFDLMQQHTGEHIVSGIVSRRYGYHNTGFHIGGDVLTVDFDGVIPAEDIPAIEAEANAAVWQNIPVKCWVPCPSELPNVHCRAKRELPWPVRIVEIPDFDCCACCGIHVAATGEIGVIKLFGTVGFRGGTRMEMACGERAFDILSIAFAQNRLVSQAFSAQITATAEAARQANEALARQKIRIGELEKRLFAITARGYAGAGDVLHFEAGLEPAGIRDLADAIAETSGGTAAVFSGSDDAGYGYCLAARQGDLRQLGKAMTQKLNGRGGGKPMFQQGRVQAARKEIEAFFGK